VGAREGARERGVQRGIRLLDSLCREWRELRLSAGLSQVTVARAVGLSRQAYARIERRNVRDIGIARAAYISAVLGIDIAMQTYPAGPPLRDAGHTNLLNRFNRQLAAAWHVTREAPMPIAGDKRAWDERLDGPTSIGVEAETRPHDLQALQRRMALKRRDGGVRRMVLVISATERNRRVLREVLPALRSSLPLGSREVLSALRAGLDPGADGIVVL
jgi:transcriptional regulator with XRE-family HTH domain